MDERRYGEQEVAEIFEAAASERPAGRRGLAPSGGMSLVELQAIGDEVGISRDRIADAAAALELRRGTAPRRTHLGLPISAGRTVELPRAPTDREWDLLVADLRETFGAHGKESSRGELRAWTNGNLHAYAEPTETGYRLRLGTVKGDAAPLTSIGIFGLLAAALMFAFLAASGEMEGAIMMALVLGTLGTVSLGSNVIRLPRWAREREAQMEHIATRARALIRAESDTPTAIEG